MKHLKNQHGYALLVVLLIIVLFLSISATFMAGSLNNAKQEQTVDTTNQSVASAEMGVNYFTSDFQRELELIKLDVSKETQLRVNDLIACIQPPRGALCSDDAKIAAIETEIDKDMRALYISKVFTKITELNALAGDEIVPFSSGQINYTILSASGKKLNDAGNVTTNDNDVKKIKVDLEMSGTSKAITKELKAFFMIDVPATFLDANESLTVHTQIPVTKDDIKYTDIFDTAEPTISCADMLAQVESGTPGLFPLYECKLAAGQTLEEFLQDIKDAGLNSKDFKVYIGDFLNEVCPKNCNSINMEGINIVVKSNDIGAFNNMNNLVNANLVINGQLVTGNNLTNLGKNGVKQIIIVKELNVTSNIQNMYYTNFLVLGREVAANQNMAVSNLKWGQNFEIDNHSRLCIDLDRILPADIQRLKEEVKFTNNGSLIYYTRNAANKFILQKKSGNTYVADPERTALYVHQMAEPTESYTTFLAACGVTISETIDEATEVSLPSILEPGFEFDVEY
ncbi:hypothetical protein AC739_02920 [Planococcus glaciei]|uniref:hypothetical protein n=1 Tax=Planococcus glaciei TaxID=459472 RepID=UPI00069DA46D|nr:hypothetical protein [Planococcus glaciei]KOF11783.1 hypothetical protein AC739_02920 [Planococcus glaciei]